MSNTNIVSASIQMLPVQSGNLHPYEWVDEVIDIIKSSGVVYEIGAFNTSIESDYESVMKVIDKINRHLLKKGCPEWILGVQLQLRTGADITSAEKLEKYK